MQTGKIKFFDEGKGFGFIEVPGEPDVFVHVRQVKTQPQTLKKGDQVSFETETGPRGPRATRVNVLGAFAHEASRWEPKHVRD